MRRLRALATLLLCLSVLGGPALAERDADASRVCVVCHDTEDLPDMSRSAHAAAADPRVPGCVSCHGASPTHVRKPASVARRPAPDVVFSKNAGAPASARNATCLGCHDRGAKRALWAGSQHDIADVACSSCHKVHTNHDKVLAKATQTEVCYACHQEQRAQMQRPSHHPVPEGKMTCGDCHNAHGSAGPKLVSRDSINDTCYSCHAEKRGPFVREHEPVTQDCATCHNPHGSVVAGMLKARQPMLCQQCHTPHVAGGIGAVGGQPGVYTPARAGRAAGDRHRQQRQERRQPVAGAQLQQLPHPGAWLQQPVGDRPDAAAPVPMTDAGRS